MAANNILPYIRELAGEWACHCFAVVLIGFGCWIESRVRAIPGIPLWILAMFDVLLLLTAAVTVNAVVRRHVQDSKWRWALVIGILVAAGLIANGWINPPIPTAAKPERKVVAI